MQTRQCPSLSCTPSSAALKRTVPPPFAAAKHAARQISFRPDRLVVGQPRATTICMANPRRVAKVAKQIEREVGSLLLTDKVVLDVTSQAAAEGAMVSCTGVEITNDLQVVKVYISMYTEDVSLKQQTLTRLSGVAGYVRHKIGERVRLRLTPEVRFLIDESFVRGERVLKLLQYAEDERTGRASSRSPPTASRAQTADNDDDEDEDEEEELDAEHAGSNDAAESRSRGELVKEPVAGTSGRKHASDTTGSAGEGEGVPKAKVNRFLVGLDEDSDEEGDEPTGFFTADMFPDAQPEVESLQAKQKEMRWKEKQGKRGMKGKRHTGRKPVKL